MNCLQENLLAYLLYNTEHTFFRTLFSSRAAREREIETSVLVGCHLIQLSQQVLYGSQVSNLPGHNMHRLLGTGEKKK